MRMNQNMANLLTQMQIDRSEVCVERPGEEPALISAGDSVFLRDEFARFRHHAIQDFADLSSLESFVNHAHFPFRKDKQSLLEAIAYTAAVQQSLCEFSSEKKFVITLCIADRHCIIRFHQIRSNESWVGDDLGTYLEESVLAVTT
jgi:hypothetical protein